ncbi:MAG: class I SAM-dependent methyltransferase [Clostridia bacterium]|nr:class I SAM-dependent methyltransferase [Clostridia bacterium]
MRELTRTPPSAVTAESDLVRRKAERIAGRLELPFAESAPDSGLYLSVGADGALRAVLGKTVFFADFGETHRRVGGGRLRSELLVRAAMGRDGAPGLAVDATAGFGGDSFILAAAGYRVIAFERNRFIAELLADGLERALCDPGTSDAASRIELRREDSLAKLPALDLRPDVVLLDPMFPVRKKSGAVKKKARMLEALEPPCSDGEALLEAAFAAHPRRIVIKRPSGAEPLGGRKPDYVLSGDVVRYDCFRFADNA